MNWVAELSVLQWSLLVVLSAAAGLDRTALAQTMLCRPVVCGSLCGIILGNYSAALFMGVVMELLWLMRLPVGASVAPDDTQATIAAVFLFSVFSAQLEPVLPAQLLMIVLLFFAAVFAHIGRLLDIGARHMNGRIQHRLQHRLERGPASQSTSYIGWANVAGLANFVFAGFLSQVIILCAILASLILVAPLLTRLPLQISDVPMYAALLAGVAAVYSSITVRYGAVLFGAGFGVTVLFTMV